MHTILSKVSSKLAKLHEKCTNLLGEIPLNPFIPDELNPLDNPSPFHLPGIYWVFIEDLIWLPPTAPYTVNTVQV